MLEGIRHEFVTRRAIWIAPSASIQQAVPSNTTTC
jgi:hypothetical protein